MAFDWGNLTAAAAGVIGALGGAGITGLLANRREDAAAYRALDAAETDRKREAYAELLVTARAALRGFRQLSIAYWADAPDIPQVNDVISQASALASELSHAAAIAELIGSADTRQSAREIYAKARKCADMYQSWAIGVAMVPNEQARAQFDIAKAQKRCDELEAAINTFADIAHGEITDDPPQAEDQAE
jgi:hypothetical protein